MPVEIKSVARNKKAYHDYFIEQTQEAGISLAGTEVKSIRMGKVNLLDAYAAVRSGELFLYNMHISPYEKGNIFNRDPMRIRKLLMHKREIRKLEAAVAQEGFSIVPTKVYLKNGRVKVEIGLAKGKKLYDKRRDLAKKDSKRAIERSLKNYG